MGHETGLRSVAVQGGGDGADRHRPLTHTRARAIRITAALSAEHRAQLMNVAHEVNFEEGTRIFGEGGRADRVPRHRRRCSGLPGWPPLSGLVVLVAMARNEFHGAV